MGKVANIRDIAKMTGYSVTTISRVINNHPYVAEEKRQKVLEVMNTLDYKPNRTAQNLSKGITKNVGVIVPFVDHPFYNQLLKGIMKAAFAHQYKITLLPTNYDEKLEKSYLEELAAKSFDGLIVTTRANHMDVFLPYLAKNNIVFCEASDLKEVRFVAIDLAASLKASILYLKKQGIKRLGLTLGRSKRLSGNSILTIAQSKKYFPDFDEADIFWDCIHAEDGFQAAEFFQKRQVDGIITNGDEVAAMILAQYPPEQKPFVIGRENLLVSQLLQFSTVDHQLKQCGKAAFQLFYEEKNAQLTIPHRLIIR
ncbi:hypothetical protein RU96_GL001522 [Enterococcus canintestini]|uniref:HTH lacI-type domain-containing protein n=1 Tax=Enterococcus canintestini TaxID=317010 RepID=A0A1L8R8I9_9ENTE|nr:hypothetical protein RU96_GL001522 [Enterococcus canintestini]